LKRKIIIALIVFIAGAALASAAALPRDMRAKLEKIRMASAVYDRNGRMIGNLYYYKRIWTPLAKMPQNLLNAVVTIEDERFYKHNGIDLKGMARAAIHNLIPGGAMEGGSTITQQLAKISLLTEERTITRKVKDMTLALQIEQTYSKKEILELYLNSVYLGHGNIGVEAASRYYFNKSVGQLSLGEAATIAGLIRSPENYSPLTHYGNAKGRRNLVLRKMWELRYISLSQYKAASGSGLKVVKKDAANAGGGYFLDYIRQQLNKNGFSEDELRFGGYKIYTTLDLNCQKEAERIMLQLPSVKSVKIQPEGALISLDAKDGGILAMVGGRSYTQSQYNRSINSYRQPGSAIKPFVYATALERGFTAASIIEDKPLTIQLPNGSEWVPENYDRNFLGPVTLRVALRNSVNTVAVQLLQQVGVDAVAEQMERMGINSLVKSGDINDLGLAPLALGGLTKGVTPLELAAAYLPFSNLGVYIEPYAIRKVSDRSGQTVKQYVVEKKAALSAQTAYIMTMLMQDVIDSGTGQRAKLAGQPAAGKTGTTSDYTNAWFVGYTPEILTAVWIGNDRQDRPMRYKERNIGSSAAAELWGAYMRKVSGKATQFEEPPGIVWADVDPKTGKAVPGLLNESTYKEVFSENNIPASGAYKVWSWFFPDKNKQEPDAAEKPDSGADDGSKPGQTRSPEQF